MDKYYGKRIFVNKKDGSLCLVRIVLDMDQGANAEAKWEYSTDGELYRLISDFKAFKKVWTILT